MKGKIFMYLFFFTALLVVFQYANEKKIYNSQKGKIENLERQLKTADSLATLSDEAVGEPYFSLDRNEKAYAYFERSGISITGLEQRVEDAIIEKNTQQGNPLIPFENTTGTFRVNKVHVLNHKWAIADFTDGKRWGEILLKYTVSDSGNINFENLNSLIYPLE